MNMNQRKPYQKFQGSDGPRPQPPMITKITPCNVTANLYKYTGKPTLLHHYNVTFEPPVAPRDTFNKFMYITEKNNFTENFAFDGFNILVSTNKFADLQLTMPFKDGELVCKIEYKNSYDMSNVSSQSSSSLIQCVETVLKFYQKKLYYVEKKKMIHPDSRSIPLASGIDVIPGLVSTFKIDKKGFSLNLDLIFGVFYKPQPLVEALKELAFTNGIRGDPLKDHLGDKFYSEFENFIKNVRLATTHRARNSAFKPSGIVNQSASQVKFEVEGKMVSVADYFTETYGPLRYPNLPLVVVTKRGTNIHIPMEVLSIAPMQKYPRKLNEKMTSELIKIAAKRPIDRFSMISEKATELSALQNETLKNFGMAFDSRMTSCQGIILPPPKILFGSNKEISVRNGSWNLIDVNASEGVKIDNWTIFAFRHSDLPPELSFFRSLASSYGVHFTCEPKTTVVRNVDEFFKANKSKFNLVILPDKNAQRYEEIKRVAETYSSRLTQCMVASNLKKMTNASFVSNLLLKINCKLGGKNWGLARPVLGDKSTIIFGIDVNHPGVADLESPSIVSVVATMDYGFTKYKTVIQQQERREEIVGNLKLIVKDMLKSHYAATKSKPARLIVFRDGVGDSMFDAVFKCEIDSIKEACRELEASYNPEVNFIVAQKRHSIRFSVDGANALPGTIVDELGNPGSFDFYLVSHNAIQGTARPVRYLVLLNESNFTNQAMYENVYHLCHLYARATKSVSVVPAIYYAHLAAARGKCYLEKNAEGATVMRSCDVELSKHLYYV